MRPNLPEWRRPSIFDLLKHGFNPLENIEYKKARELAEVLYTISPQGEHTLTVRNGKRALLKALLRTDSLDKIRPSSFGRKKSPPAEELEAMIEDMLASPVFRKVLCESPQFF
jgi:hypothetical protein